MQVHLKANRRCYPNEKLEITSFQEASKAVRTYITEYELGSGCGHFDFFTGGNIIEKGKTIARVSYNGLIWNLNNVKLKEETVR